MPATALVRLHVLWCRELLLMNLYKGTVLGVCFGGFFICGSKIDMIDILSSLARARTAEEAWIDSCGYIVQSSLCLLHLSISSLHA